MEPVNCPLYEHANRTPKHPALITKQRTWTYEELNAQIQAICRFLENAGVKAHQRVAFVAQNSPASILLFFALFRLRAIACPLSYRLPQRQLSEYIQLLKAAQVLEPSLLPPDMAKTSFQQSVIHPDDLATFLFTSGSIGTPKIACHTFANHYNNASSALPLLKMEPMSRWLLSLPLFHVSGIGILFRCFLSGATVVLSELSIPESICKYGISHLSVVPTQLARLFKEPNEIQGKMKESLQCVLLGGAPISTSFQNEAKQHGFPVFTTYGMTEMSSMITLSELNAIGHSGKLLPMRTLKFEQDEILVGGKTLFQGYWDTLNETVKSSSQDEWFATKDLGRLTKEGNLEITGRRDRQFISGGENIQPEEIEEALCAIPGIRQASVLPVADEEFGERPVAFIDDENRMHTLETIRNALKDRLPSFKHPVRILPYPRDTGLKPNIATLRQHLLESSSKNRV